MNRANSLASWMLSGALAGQVGGLVFAAAMLELGVLESIASVVRADESFLIGVPVHMTIAAIVGALTGFLVGTLASSISVSIVTSFGGSLLWMTSSAVFARELGLSDNLYSMLPAPGWLLLWGMSGIIGLSIQWTYQSRRADKQA